MSRVKITIEEIVRNLNDEGFVNVSLDPMRGYRTRLPHDPDLRFIDALRVARHVLADSDVESCIGPAYTHGIGWRSAREARIQGPNWFKMPRKEALLTLQLDPRSERYDYEVLNDLAPIIRVKLFFC